jgi:arylsulfatase A-like enzyme
VRVVPITREGYETDDVLVQWLLDDLESEPGLQLFVVDLSTVDMTAHAFGAWTAHYTRAIEETDGRLERLFGVLERRGVMADTTVILTSDHGQSCLDHSYLLNDDEKYVPLILCGAGVRRGARLRYRPSITDYAPTIAWLLGVRYPKAAMGRVLSEAIEGAPLPEWTDEVLEAEAGGAAAASLAATVAAPAAAGSAEGARPATSSHVQAR